MKKLIYFIIFIIVVFILIITDAFFIEPNLLITKHKSLYLPNWDKNLNGYKIAVISDLHVGNKFVNIKKLKRIVNKTNKEKSDLILLLGDLDAEAIKNNYNENEITNVLSGLSSKDGVISVLGNHDYEIYNPDNTILNIYKNSNITLLQNNETNIIHNNTQIRIIGFKDLWHFYLNPKAIIGKKTKNTIVLTHNPDSFPDIPHFVSLTISGHTHGGEVYLPIVGSPFVPSKFGQKYRKGHIREDNKNLFVTSGIASLSKMRFLNPPEICILTLYAQ